MPVLYEYAYASFPTNCVYSVSALDCTAAGPYFTGASVPNGIVTAGPFCAPGNADVK